MPLAPYGIYIHVPFCASRCIYCDFYSTTQTAKAGLYVEAVIREMMQRAHDIQGRVETIYFGGGTPTQLGREGIGRILEALHQQFDLSHCHEITLEANPEDFITGAWRLEKEKRRADEPLGSDINRVSMGVQSMVDEELNMLHRRHNAEHVREAVERLRETGITNLSLDLMYGLPGQTMQSWAYSIDEVIALKPQHISAYNLSIEEGTPLSRMVEKREVTVCDDETCLAMAALLRDKLHAAGYEQYEISNYALPEYHSRHNSSYWTQTPYLGLGPGAHSYDGKRRRSWNACNLNEYLQGKREEEEEMLTDLDLYNECVMLGLRTKWGIDARCFERYFTDHATLDNLHTTLLSLQGRGLVHTAGDRICLTEEGLALADEVIRELIVI